MPYIIRNAQGSIIGVSIEPTEDTIEYLPGAHPEVTAFQDRERERGGDELSATDFSMARVTEDLVELLVNKKIIELSELPEQAQRKLRLRKSLRVGTNGLES